MMAPKVQPVLQDLPALRIIRHSGLEATGATSRLRKRHASPQRGLTPLPPLPVIDGRLDNVIVGEPSQNQASRPVVNPDRLSPENVTTSVVEVDVTDLLQAVSEIRCSGSPSDAFDIFTFAAVQALVHTSPPSTTSSAGLTLAVHESTPDGDVVGVVLEAELLTQRALRDRIHTAERLPVSDDAYPEPIVSVRDAGARGFLVETAPLHPQEEFSMTLGAIAKRQAIIDTPSGGHSFAVRSIAMLSLSYNSRRMGRFAISAYLQRLRGYLQDGDWIRSSVGVSRLE